MHDDRMAHAWQTVSVQRLARGVNLSHWYGQVYRGPGYVPEHFESWMRDADFDLIVAAGFDHVRFPIALEQLAPDGALDPAFAARTVAEVGRLHAVGLAVIVDGHPELDFRRALVERPTARDQFVALWRDFASTLADLPTSHTAFELLNEPGLGDAALWNTLALRAITAIREVAPDHTIVMSGDGYSDIAELIQVDVATCRRTSCSTCTTTSRPPSPTRAPTSRRMTCERSPTCSTHWTCATPHACLVHGARRAAARTKDYVRAGWSLETYRGIFRAAAEFAGTRPLTCNEFGVFNGAPADEARVVR